MDTTVINELLAEMSVYQTTDYTTFQHGCLLRDVMKELTIKKIIPRPVRTTRM